MIISHLFSYNFLFYYLIIISCNYILLYQLIENFLTFVRISYTILLLCVWRIGHHGLFLKKYFIFFLKINKHLLNIFIKF